MKDAFGHGSSVKTINGRPKHPSNIFGNYTPPMKAAYDAIAARKAQAAAPQYDAIAARTLATGRKSTAPNVHDSMASTIRSQSAQFGNASGFRAIRQSTGENDD